MKRTVTIWAWLLVLALAIFYTAGAVTGYSLGTAHADGCNSFYAFGFGQRTCDYTDAYGVVTRCTENGYSGRYVQNSQSNCVIIYTPPQSAEVQR